MSTPRCWQWAEELHKGESGARTRGTEASHLLQGRASASTCAFLETTSRGSLTLSLLLGPRQGTVAIEPDPGSRVGVGGGGAPESQHGEQGTNPNFTHRAQTSQLLSAPLWGDESGTAKRFGPVLLTPQCGRADFLQGHGVTPPGHRSRCTHSADQVKAPSLPWPRRPQVSAKCPGRWGRC